jgi:hypothetical protein
MSIETSGMGLPPDTDVEKLNDAIEMVDKVDRIDASISPESQAATMAQNTEAHDRRFRLLEEKAMASMVGGPKLSFNEKQEVINGWGSKLEESEREDLIARLEAVK